jgi:hypothetical protein
MPTFFFERLRHPWHNKGVLAMAVRHEVENLVRRGNIFYWRPRIPSCFATCPAGSRLSLSLQISDRGKAPRTLPLEACFGVLDRLAERRFSSDIGTIQPG